MDMRPTIIADTAITTEITRVTNTIMQVIATKNTRGTNIMSMAGKIIRITNIQGTQDMKGTATKGTRGMKIMSMADMITQSIADTITRITNIQGTQDMKGTRITTAPIPAMKDMMNITTMSTAATRVMKGTITAMEAEAVKIRILVSCLRT